MPRPPYALLGASAVEMLEGAVVLGLGVFVGVSTLAGTPDDIGRALALAGFTLLGGAAMIFVGIGLLWRRRWARAPAVVTQVLGVLVGFQTAQSGQLAVGVPLLLVAVGALASLFAPATSRALPHN